MKATSAAEPATTVILINRPSRRFFMILRSPVEAVGSRPRPQLTRHFRIRRRRHLGLDRLFLDKYFRLAQPDIDLPRNQQDADGEKERADRTLDEGHQIAAGDQQAAPEVFLETRSKHVADGEIQVETRLLYHQEGNLRMIARSWK